MINSLKYSSVEIQTNYPLTNYFLFVSLQRNQLVMIVWTS